MYLTVENLVAWAISVETKCLYIGHYLLDFGDVILLSIQLVDHHKEKEKKCKIDYYNVSLFNSFFLEDTG